MKVATLLVAAAAGVLNSTSAAASASTPGPGPSAPERLLFCNRPEKIRLPGAYADTLLTAGRTYRIFFHYRNGTREAGPLVVAFQGLQGKTLGIEVRKGIGDPKTDPALVGRQATARFLHAPTRRYAGRGGGRFPILLRPKEVASGILTVRTDQAARLRIYFRHNRWTVPEARVIAVDAPRRDIQIVLSPETKRRYYRIGVPDTTMDRRLDGAYGLLYAFKVDAPAGRRVRIAFSPRGGHAGLVGTFGGILRQSRIVGAAGWSVFCEAVVGKEGMVLTTLPFGGAFYPVELAFELL